MVRFFEYGYQVASVLLCPEKWRWMSHGGGPVLCECISPVMESRPSRSSAGVASARFVVRKRVDGKIQVENRKVRGWDRAREAFGNVAEGAFVQQAVFARSSQKDEGPPAVFCAFVDEASVLVKKGEALFSASVVVAVRRARLGAEFDEVCKRLRDRLPWIVSLSAERPWGEPDPVFDGYFRNAVGEMPLRGLFLDEEVRHRVPLGPGVFAPTWDVEMRDEESA